MVYAAPEASSSAPTRSNYLTFSRSAIWLVPQDQQWSLLRAGRILPHADAGMSGVAGDGEAIICENNNGLRWEPA